MRATVENVRLWKDADLMKMRATINGKEIEHSVNLKHEVEGEAMKTLQRCMELVCRVVEKYGDDADPMDVELYHRLSCDAVRPEFYVPISGA